MNADKKKAAGQGAFFDVWRFHPFFTTVPETETVTVAMDQLHRQQAIIENGHADLKDSAIAHLPSGSFTANAAWLVLAVIAFNLTRANGTLTDDLSLLKATTGTLRRKIINVPARISSSARKLAMHLPDQWPWQHGDAGSTPSEARGRHRCARPADNAHGLTAQPHPAAQPETSVEHSGSEARRSTVPPLLRHPEESGGHSTGAISREIKAQPHPTFPGH